jgi:RNA polymerase sigma factor (TIGR02999 family)
MSDVTEVLSALDRGETDAAERLLPLVQDELRRLAAQKLACDKPSETHDATALVHAAYQRLIGADKPPAYRDRAHFFAVAARAMRRILIEKARVKLAQQDDPQQQQIDAATARKRDEELVALDEALEKLAATDPLKARLVELRYFAGLTGAQAAEVLGIPPAAADRSWAFARAWLQTEVRGQ